MPKYDNLSDEKLAEMVRSQDKELYIHIVKRYENKLLRYVDYLIKDKDMSADIVQGTFIKAFINLNSFKTKKKFSSWIYRIAHNEALNSIKKYKKEVRMDLKFDHADTKEIEDEFNKKEITIKVNMCLNRLPVTYSEPLVLYFLEEKSYQEISDILRIPMGTVGIKIRRAKMLMKQICQKNS